MQTITVQTLRTVWGLKIPMVNQTLWKFHPTVNQIGGVDITKDTWNTVKMKQDPQSYAKRTNTKCQLHTKQMRITDISFSQDRSLIVSTDLHEESLKKTWVMGFHTLFSQRLLFQHDHQLTTSRIQASIGHHMGVSKNRGTPKWMV